MLDVTKKEELLQNIEDMMKEGEVTELRILNTGQGTVSGYFDDPQELVKWIDEYNGFDKLF